MVPVAHSFRVIESQAAPTPEQLGVGVSISLIATTVGLALGCVGVVLLVFSLWQLTRLRRSYDDSSTTASAA